MAPQTQLTPADFEGADGLQDWRVISEGGCIFFRTASLAESARLVRAIAELPDPVPPERAQARLEALQELQRDRTLAYHRSRVGERTRVLVHGPSRRGGRQLAGRDPQHRVVNFELPEGRAVPAGSLQAVRLVEATPHALVGELDADRSPWVKTAGCPADDGICSGGVPGPEPAGL